MAFVIQRMIVIEKLFAKYYSNGKKAILNGIDLKVNSEKVAIIGPNGSGKTTLLRAILGLVRIESGNIYIFGTKLEDIRSKNIISANLPEIYRLIGLKIGDLIKLYSELKEFDSSYAFSLLREFQMDSVLNERLYELSSGQMKMVCNILALSGDNKIILLDEPFENVDYSRKNKLIDVLNNLSSIIILNTHELQVLSKLDSWLTYFMVDGNLSNGFVFNDLNELFLAKGRVENAVAYIETSVGTLSIMKSRSDFPLSKISNLDTIWEVIS